MRLDTPYYKEHVQVELIPTLVVEALLVLDLTVTRDKIKGKNTEDKEAEESEPTDGNE